MFMSSKKIAILHRYPKERIKETNAAFPYLLREGVEVKTFRTFNRLNDKIKFIKSVLWIFYAPLLVIGRDYDVIYCDDSFPFYPALVKLACPKAKVIIRLGDLHLMYYCSGRLYRILHYFEKIAWRMADMILPISEAMAHHILTDGYDPGRPSKMRVVLDPVDPKDFPECIDIDYETDVLFHGLLVKNKNVQMLLTAATYLPNLTFGIVGDGPDMRRLEKVKPANVKFAGWKPFYHIPRYIANCRVGVALRSDNPGNEFVVTSPFLQYSVMGKPCLVSRRKVFGDYLWQFSTVKELVEKIKLLLDRPEEGEKMRQYVLKNHDAEKIADQIWGLLNG